MERKMTKGNALLITHIESLLERAKAGEFDDFLSEHATPKMVLYNEFGRFQNAVKDGLYD